MAFENWAVNVQGPRKASTGATRTTAASSSVAGHQRLGHTASEPSLDAYSYLRPDMQEEAARRLDTALLTGLSGEEPWAPAVNG
jgi:hypothetical protein